MNKTTFENGISILCELFPTKIVKPSLYWELLKDLTYEEFLKAVNDISKSTTELYPNTNLIAVIREKAKQSSRELPGEAWQVVLLEVSNTGSYGSPKFTDPLIERAVASMGWKNICLSTNQIADRAHFMKIYETLVSRQEKENIVGSNNKIALPKEFKDLIKNIGIDK